MDDLIQCFGENVNNDNNFKKSTLRSKRWSTAFIKCKTFCNTKCEDNKKGYQKS